MAEIGELGPLRVWIGSDELTMTGGRRSAVLALLALRGHDGASLDYLADTVWADAPNSSRTSLTTTIMRLRKQLGSDAIETDGSDYRLAPHVISHRERFLTIVRNANGPDGDPATVLERADEAQTLWRGEPWHGLDDVAPLLADRVMLRDARLRLIEAEARAAGHTDDRVRQLQALRHLVDARPHHEGWWHDLAQATAEDGDRTAALRLLQDARNALDQVGLLPGPDLIALEQHLVGSATPAVERPAAGVEPRRGDPTLRVAETLPFLGRDGDIERLTTEHASALSPAYGVGVVEGAAGAGKSRLLVEIARRCTGHVVLSGRCAQSIGSQLGPLNQILDEYAATTSPADLARDAAGLEAILAPHLAALGAPAPSAAIAGTEERAQLVRACTTLLLRAGARSPCLLLIDDLQWASDVVLDIVEGVALRASPHETCILASCRIDGSTTADATRLANLMGGPTSGHLKLAPLTSADITAIIEATGSTAEPEDLHQRTGGSPFFLDQVLRTDGSASGDSLLRLVAARVELVHAKAADFMRAASLIGLEFDPGLAGTVAELDAETAAETVDALTADGLLLPSAAAANMHTFAHGLVAEAMHAEMSTHERRRLHLAIATARQTAGAPDYEWISHLLDAGPLVDQSTLIPAVAEAGAHLLRRGQCEAALRIIETAQQRQLGPTDRVTLLTLTGEVCVERGKDHTPPLLEASQIAVDHGLDDQLIDVALTYSRGGPWLSNHDANGPRLLQLALDRCPADRDDLRTRIESRLACYDIFTGALDDRLRASEEALELATTSGDTAVIAEALNTSIVAIACPATLAQTRRFEDELLRLEQAGLGRSAITNRPAVSTFWMADGAQFRADVAERRDEAHRATHRQAQALNGLETVLAIFDNDLDRARSLLADQVLDSDVERGNYAWNTVLIEWLEGTPERALDVVRSTYDDFRGAPLRYTTLWLAVEAGATTLTGELLATITPPRVHRTPEVFLGGYALAGLAMTAYLQRDRELAELTASVLAPLEGHMLGVPWSGFPSADFFLALLADVQGDDGARSKLAGSARRLHDRMTAASFNILVDRYLPE